MEKLNGIPVTVTENYIAFSGAGKSFAVHTDISEFCLGGEEGRGSHFQKIASTPEGVLYYRNQLRPGSYPPLDCAVKCAVDRREQAETVGRNQIGKD
jgi:hypothetical protein